MDAAVVDRLFAELAALKRLVRAAKPDPDPAAELLGDGCLKVAAAARFSGIGRTELYQHMAAGRLPWAKVGKNRLIPKRALVALLAANLTPGRCQILTPPPPAGDGPESRS